MHTHTHTYIQCTSTIRSTHITYTCAQTYTRMHTHTHTTAVYLHNQVPAHTHTQRTRMYEQTHLHKHTHVCAHTHTYIQCTSTTRSPGTNFPDLTEILPGDMYETKIPVSPSPPVMLNPSPVPLGRFSSRTYAEPGMWDSCATVTYSVRWGQLCRQSYTM